MTNNSDPKAAVEGWITKSAKQPDAGKWVELDCEDWSPYKCTGMFVTYKKGSGKRTGKSRFMCKDPRFKELEAARDCWTDCIQWRYLNEPG